MQKNIYLSILITALLLLNQITTAQVAINTNGAPPNPSAMLDVVSTTKGLLIPRVALTATNSNLPIGSSIANGLMVYNTFTSNVLSPFPVVPGIYYWDGAKWIYMGVDKSWALGGNAGTTAGNFIGTTDNRDIVFKRNFVQAGLLNDAAGNTSWGVNALNPFNTGAFNSAFGNFSLQNLSSGMGNTGIGNSSLQNNTTGTSNTAIGATSLKNNNAGNENTAIGYEALKTNTSGGMNIGSGFQALYSNTIGSENTAQGYQALYSNNTGSYNTAAGLASLYSNDAGTYNTASGYYSLYSNTSGVGNTAFGWRALRDNTTSHNNTAVGNTALLNNTGHNNTSIGTSALQNNTLGNYNTGLGDNTLISNTIGSFNTGLGSGANTNALTYSNTTAVGANSVTTASDQVRVGSSNVLSIGGFQNWTNVSDERFKKDVTESVPGLAFIKKLRPVTYRLDMDKIATFLKTPGERRFKDAEATKASVLQTGFIAQEVEKAALELGYNFSGIDKPKNANDYYGLRYAEFTIPMVKAMQEQQVMIEKLNADNNKLSLELIELRKVIDELKSLLPLAIKKN